MNTTNLKTLHSQKGAITLLVTVLILIAMTIGSFGMLNTTRLETSMTLNDQRNREALHAAQAGIDFFLAHIGSDSINQEALCNPDNWIVSETNTGQPDFLLSFTGPVASAFNFNPTTQSEECNGIPFEITTKASIWSRGFSRDGEAVRTLSSDIDLSVAWNYSTQSARGGLIGLGGSPLVVRTGDIGVGGNMDIGLCNTSDCGALTASNSSGNEAVIRDENLITYGSDGSLTVDRSGPGERFGDSSFTASEEIQAMDANEFFATYAGDGITKTEFINSENTQELDGIGAGKKGADTLTTGNQFYIDGDVTINSNVEIGTQENPVIIVISSDSQVRFNGNVTIWGTVYLENGDLTANGTFRVMGRLISENSLNVSGNGNFAVYSDNSSQVVPRDFDPDESIASTDGERSAFVRIGSWREITN